MSWVKVCGLTRERDLSVAVDAGADAVGLIAGVPVDTPREIPLDRAATLAADTPSDVTAVLVTMPDSAAEAIERVERVQPDAVQIHGIPPADVDTLADELSLRSDGPPLLVAVDATDPDLDAYANAADLLVLDAVDEQGAGGTGRTTDWEQARAVVSEFDTRIVLAGGLTPANVTRAVEAVAPFGVDVASGVEADGGVKNHDAVRQFVRRATQADTDTTPVVGEGEQT